LADDVLKALCLLPLAKIKFDMDIDDLATAADASEAGGGVCASTGLTAMGRSRLQEGERRVDRPVTDSLLLVELFAGIGAARRGLRILGVTPGTHIISEVSEDALAVLREAHPDARFQADVQTLHLAAIKALTADNPHIKHVLIVGGSPGQDLSGLNRTAVGLEGPRSSLLYAMIQVEAVVEQLWPEALIESIWENVASMTAKNRDKISKLKGNKPSVPREPLAHD